MFDLITVSVDKQRGFIRMNRPDKRNALSEETVKQVINALKDLEKDPEVKVIILSGEGPAFSAGGDVSEMDKHNNLAESMAWMKQASELTQTIANLDKYVIAAVHGFAAGAGFSVALASDFIIAEKSTKFICSFTNVGLVPDLGLTKLLTERLPLTIAKEWIATAKPISAETLYEKGLVNRLTNEGVVREAVEFTQSIIDGPPLSHLIGKKILNVVKDTNLDAALIHESIAQVLLNSTSDHKEGISAFLEKRPPSFEGR
ncbi:enoyl-CoA hydratase/isomerase family protein [Oceanobacillus halophilus]|uniref:Enoyl-CoA hydratase/isomerase family protein n=1 Tax=Oceanobacillus halophilus TaxID=930130 RepID=A0A495A7X5_9BACI|nr:enoyl-CoA hydratase/isomerase family protein [Oceanobacillus halophilus]RKQ35763.1 enoyl-CoA hydratase/isomerase family protein [Oceanobacillus halophilus]